MRADPNVKEAAWCMRDHNEMITNAAQLNANFDAYDLDHSGTIDRKEMKKAYKNAYKDTLLASKTKEERKQILAGWMDSFFDKYDLSGDGSIGKDEFKTVFNSICTGGIKEKLKKEGITIDFLKEKISEINGFINEDLYIAESQKERSDIIAAYAEFVKLW